MLPELVLLRGLGPGMGGDNILNMKDTLCQQKKMTLKCYCLYHYIIYCVTAFVVFTCREDNPSSDTFKHSLKLHINRVVDHNEDVCQRINVKRSDVFHDGIRAFQQSSFDARKCLKVRFIGEPAVDQGGPQHEFSAFSSLKWANFLACFRASLIVYHLCPTHKLLQMPCFPHVEKYLLQ